MHSVKIIAAAIALAAPLAVQATTLTFDAGGATGTYSEAGVFFSAVGGTSNIFSYSTPNGTLGLLETSAPKNLMRADITGGASMVSVDLGDFNADPDLLVLRVYSAADVLLGSTSLLIDSSFTGMMTLSLSASNIAYAIFGSEAPSINGSSVYADNFIFAPVPEPESYAMLLAGLGIMGAVARRKSCKSA